MISERLEKLKKMLEETPNDPFLNYALGMEYLKDDPLKAWEIFQKMLDRFPDYLPTYYQAAQLAISLGQHNSCTTIFVKGIDLAKEQNDLKTLAELNSAYQNYLYDA